MKIKFHKNFFSLIVIFLVSFGFLRSCFPQSILASSISNNTIIESQEVATNYKQTRAFGISAVLAWATKIWGYKTVKAITGALSYYGLRQSCKRWNDSNALWDFICDVTPSGYFD